MTVSDFRFGRTKKTYQTKLLASAKYLTNYCISVAYISE